MHIDDTIVVCLGKVFKDNGQDSNNSLEMFNKWRGKNKIALNLKKGNIMLLGCWDVRYNLVSYADCYTNFRIFINGKLQFVN